MTHKLLSVALALALLVGAVGAAGAVAAQEAPDDANDHDAQPGDAGPDEDRDAGAPDDVGADAADDAGAGDRPGAAGDRGPPLDLPDQVPDHVTKIHETIDEFHAGNVTNLGEALSDFLPDVVPGDGAGEDADDGGDEEETEDDDADDEESDDTEETDDEETDGDDAEQ